MLRWIRLGCRASSASFKIARVASTQVDRTRRDVSPKDGGTPDRSTGTERQHSFLRALPGLCRDGALSMVLAELKSLDRATAVRFSLEAIRCFQASKKSDAALRVWDEFQLSAQPLQLAFGDSDNFNFALSMLTQNKRHTDAIRLFKELRQAGRVCNSFGFSAAVTSYLASGDVVSAEAVVTDAVAAGIRNPLVWNSLLNHFGSIGNVAAVNRLLQRMIDSGVAPNTRSFNALLRAHCRVDSGEDFAAAESVFDRMVKSDSQPDVVTFNILLDMYAKAGDTKGAESVLQRMYRAGLEGAAVSPTIVTFSTLMSAYVSSGDTVGAEAVYKRMDDAGVRPDIVAFCTLMSVYAASGDTVGAEAVLKRMEEARVRPNIVAFSTLVAAYAAIGDAPGAEAVFKRMDDAGVRPNIVALNTLMSVYAASGDAVGAEAVFKRMDDAGGRPDIVAFSILMSAYAVCGDTDGAVAVFKRMEEARVRPDIVAFSTLMSVYAASGDTVGAEAVLKRMDDAGVRPNTVAFNTLMSAYAASGDTLGVEAVYKRMGDAGVRPDIVAFCTLMSAYAASGDTLGAEAVLKRMEEARVRPGIVAFSTLMSAYATIGDIVGTEGVHKRLTEAGVQLDKMGVGLLAQVYRNAGKVDLVMRILRSSVEQGVPLDDGICSQLIGYYADRDDASGIAVARDWLHSLAGVEQGPFMFLAEAEMYHKRRRPDVLEQMVKDSVLRGWHSVTAALLSMQMDVFLDKRQFEDALNAFERAVRFRPCGNTLASQLIRLYHLRGDELATVEDVFRRQIPDSARDVVLYSYMLDVYRQRGRGDKVEHLLREMIDRGMRMTPLTALTLLKQMVSDRQLQVALNTLLMLDQPLVAECFDVVERALLDAGQAQQAAVVRARRVDFQRRRRLLSPNLAKHFGVKKQKFQEALSMSMSGRQRHGMLSGRGDV